MELYELTIQQAHDLLKNRQISAVELTRTMLARIDRVEPQVDAFLHVDADQALEQAAAADRRIGAGDIAPLTGIPIAVKDLICTRGAPTTCASKILDGFVPPYDAFVIQRLKAAGAVIIGKTNMDEFAMGSSTENSAFKPTRNPWDPTRIPGGSSGGSAAAVAADMALAALGSDTGGSIRQPASHCGVVGLKPTYGRVSRFGLVAFASSLDQIGPLTKTVGDAACVLEAIAGHDPNDSTCVPQPVPRYRQGLGALDLKGVTIGIVDQYQGHPGIDPEVAGAVAQAVATIQDLGARTVSVSLPHTAYGIAAYYVIAPCEASSNLARYDGVKYGLRDRQSGDIIQMVRRTRSAGFGPEVKRRVIIGTYALSAGYYDAYYKKASQVRSRIIDDFAQAFARCDVIVTPVAPTPAFLLGEKTGDPLTMYLSDVFTIAANMAGIPGLALPCGFSAKGLPIGLQMLGRHFDEATVLNVGHAFEQATAFHKRKPAICQ